MVEGQEVGAPEQREGRGRHDARGAREEKASEAEERDYHDEVVPGHDEPCEWVSGDRDVGDGSEARDVVAHSGSAHWRMYTQRQHAPMVSIASASLKIPMFPSSFPAICTAIDEPFTSACSWYKKCGTNTIRSARQDRYGVDQISPINRILRIDPRRSNRPAPSGSIHHKRIGPSIMPAPSGSIHWHTINPSQTNSILLHSSSYVHTSAFLVPATSSRLPPFASSCFVFDICCGVMVMESKV